MIRVGESANISSAWDNRNTCTQSSERSRDDDRCLFGIICTQHSDIANARGVPHAQINGWANL